MDLAQWTLLTVLGCLLVGVALIIGSALVKSETAAARFALEPSCQECTVNVDDQRIEPKSSRALILNPGTHTVTIRRSNSIHRVEFQIPEGESYWRVSCNPTRVLENG